MIERATEGDGKVCVQEKRKVKMFLISVISDIFYVSDISKISGISKIPGLSMIPLMSSIRRVS